MRVIIIFCAIIICGYLSILGYSLPAQSDKPIFLKSDEIAKDHHTNISVSINSSYRPDTVQLQKLIQDYSNIWAHLNHLYATNDIVIGKEYYTENWLKFLAYQYTGKQQPIISRTDLNHELNIENWSNDGLLCTVIDKNIELNYTNSNNIIKSTRAEVAMILLFQGDNWRIDALRIINEIPFIN